ncbi:hypothetical protein GCM10010504_11440 [Streptomyces griseus]|nr:hypothetical protein GCM10010504_11440 [Streptomyces griseus]
MGLMSWLRGDRGRSRAGDAPVPVPGPAGADRGDRVDVNRLEPLQRMVSGQQLTSSPTEFEASLTTRQSTVLGTPLGHVVSPDAPSGLVRGVGVAESAPTPSSPSSSSGVAAQRSVEMPLRGAVTHFGRSGGGEALLARGPEVSGAEPGPGPVSGPVSVPVQRLYGNEGSGLTSVAGGGEELPVRRLVGERAVVPEAPSSPVPPSDPAAPAGPASGSVGVQRAAMPPAGERPRRVPGLGAPLPGLPPTAQRRAASSPEATEATEASGTAGTSGGSEASGAFVSQGPPAASGPSGSGPAADADAPVAPLLGEDPLAGAGAAGGTGGTGDAGGTGGSLQRSVGPASVPGPAPAPPSTGPPVAPLLGDRPLVPQNVDVQRAAGPDPEPEPAVGAAPNPAVPTASPPEGVPVRWAEAAGGGGLMDGPGVPLGPAPPRASAAPTIGPAAPLQRQASGGRPPVPASVARSLPGRLPGASPGSGRAPYMPSSGAGGGAGDVAVAAGVAQRMADGSVVFRGAPASGTSRPVVQRDAEIAETAEEPPPPEPDPVDVPEPEGSAEPGAVTAGGGSDAAGATDGKGAPAVTDELVRALYAPLSRLLKNDLRLERERAGHLINTRH